MNTPDYGSDNERTAAVNTVNPNYTVKVSVMVDVKAPHTNEAKRKAEEYVTQLVTRNHHKPAATTITFVEAASTKRIKP